MSELSVKLAPGEKRGNTWVISKQKRLTTFSLHETSICQRRSRGCAFSTTQNRRASIVYDWAAEIEGQGKQYLQLLLHKLTSDEAESCILTSEERQRVRVERCHMGLRLKAQTVEGGEA